MSLRFVVLFLINLLNLQYLTTFCLYFMFLCFVCDCLALHDTLKQCQENIEQEFEDVIEWVTERKKVLREQLRDRYNERCDLLEKQIESLKKHEINIKETKQECHLTIQSMDVNDPKRGNKIVNNCSKCIKSNPKVNQVPINLHFSWSDHDRVLRQFQRYGKINFNNYKSGTRMEFTSCDVNVTPIINVSNNNNNKKKIKTNIAAGGKVIIDQQQQIQQEQQPDVGRDELSKQTSKEIALPDMRGAEMRYLVSSQLGLKRDLIWRKSLGVANVTWYDEKVPVVVRAEKLIPQPIRGALLNQIKDLQKNVKDYRLGSVLGRGTGKIHDLIDPSLNVNWFNNDLRKKAQIEANSGTYDYDGITNYSHTLRDYLEADYIIFQEQSKDLKKPIACWIPAMYDLNDYKFVSPINNLSWTKYGNNLYKTISTVFKYMIQCLNL